MTVCWKWLQTLWGSTFLTLPRWLLNLPDLPTILLVWSPPFTCIIQSQTLRSATLVELTVGYETMLRHKPTGQTNTRIWLMQVRPALHWKLEARDSWIYSALSKAIFRRPSKGKLFGDSLQSDYPIFTKNLDSEKHYNIVNILPLFP